MAPLFGAIAQDGSSHITSSSVYSPYPPPLRSSRDRQPVARPTVLQSVRNSIHSLFSSNASTVDASTPPPLPQFTPKPQPLTLNTSQWTLPTFAFGIEPDQPPSANFSHDAPLYEPHPVADFASPSAADQSPRLDETQRSPANYRPLTPRTLSRLQPQTSQSHGHGVQTPPAVCEFRRQSRLDIREMMFEAGNSDDAHHEGHRRQFSGADREELILCHEVERRQKAHKEHKRKKSSVDKTKQKKKSGQKKKEKTWNGKYSPCLSSSKKRLRNKSIGCFVAGGALMIAVSTYLALALSGTPLSSEGHVCLILLIAAITLVFCHFLLAVARMAFAKPTKSPSAAHNRRQRQQRSRDNLRDVEMQRDEHGYAIPSQPVPIVFAETNDVCDPSAQTSYYAPEYTSRQATPNSPKMAPPPPAYGIWRESVRVDPNHIFWARNPNATPHVGGALPVAHTDTLAMLEGRNAGQEGGARPGLRRPPSYASDVSALSDDEGGWRERGTWTGERREEAERREAEMMFVHPSLRR